MATRGKTDDHSKQLVEALSAVAGENHAQLARLVSMPEETARHKALFHPLRHISTQFIVVLHTKE